MDHTVRQLLEHRHLMVCFFNIRQECQRQPATSRIEEVHRRCQLTVRLEFNDQQRQDYCVTARRTNIIN